jgi:GMP reductase
MRRQRALGGAASLPVVPANMKTVVDEKICAWLAQNFYVMHRFDIDNVASCATCSPGLFASISLGVKAPDYATVDRLVAEGICPNTSPSTSPTAMPTA